MDFIAKAKIRLEHWISHNEHHIKEYEEFVEELKKSGKIESATHLKRMIDLLIKSNEHLRNALNSLEK